MPRTTEAERMAVQRVGQDIFRSDCWSTGDAAVRSPALPKRSCCAHLTSEPWKDCETDAERLDVHNGLLLSALWDAAFDRGFVTFDDDGRPVYSPTLSESARAELRWSSPLSLTNQHRAKLAWHRQYVFANL
jgi:hypothetical protein